MKNIEEFITLNYKIKISSCFFVKKGFTCNKWILYATNGQKYILKELNYENNSSAERLCYITNFLLNSNLTVEILKTVTDEKYYVYFENKYYILQKYFEHISFDAISVEESLLWNIGELLCKCHIQLQKIELEPFSYYSADFSANQINGALKSEKNKEIHKILVKKKALIEEMDLKNLTRKYSSINQKFIHGDYYFDNILLNNNNFKLIDLDRSCLFFQPYEIFKGALFCSYSKNNSDTDNFKNIKSFIGGYFNTDKSNINDTDVVEYNGRIHKKTKIKEIIMAKKYDLKIKKECIAARLEGRTVKSINEEYGLGMGTLKNWMIEYYETAPKTTLQEFEIIKKFDMDYLIDLKISSHNQHYYGYSTRYCKKVFVKVFNQKKNFNNEFNFFSKYKEDDIVGFGEINQKFVLITTYYEFSNFDWSNRKRIAEGAHCLKKFHQNKLYDVEEINIFARLVVKIEFIKKNVVCKTEKQILWEKMILNIFDIFDKRKEKIIEIYNKMEKTLVHSDFGTRNLKYYNKLELIDFERIKISIPYFDFVKISLLELSELEFQYFLTAYYDSENYDPTPPIIIDCLVFCEILGMIEYMIKMHLIIPEFEKAVDLQLERLFQEYVMK